MSATGRNNTMKNFKKPLTLILASAMVLSLAGCEGGSTAASASESSSEESDTTDSAVSAYDEDMITITFFNSKPEIQDQLEELSAKYAEEYGVNIIFSFPSEDIVSYAETQYAAGTPYTMVMLEAKDISELGSKYSLDLKDQTWVEDTDYAYVLDGDVVGFPFCIEAFGIIYNADAIEKVTGEKFDPDDIIYLNDFVEFLDRLVADGMEHPTVIQKTYWSLSHHYLQQMYDEREDTETVIERLYSGKVDIIDDEKFNALMDTFDVLMKYNLFSESPTKASDNQVMQAIATGEAAFKFGGCWEWDDYKVYEGCSDNIGIMPVPQDIEDEYTGYLDGGVTKYIMVDGSEYTTDEQREAALDFLDWLVYDDEGKELISDTFGLISPFRNNNVPCSNPLSETVKEYADDGKLIQTYENVPSDYQFILGDRMQDYLGETISRRELAMFIEEYWLSATPPVS